MIFKSALFLLAHASSVLNESSAAAGAMHRFKSLMGHDLNPFSLVARENEAQWISLRGGERIACGSSGVCSLKQVLPVR